MYVYFIPFIRFFKETGEHIPLIIKYKVISCLITLIILFPVILVQSFTNINIFPALPETRSFWAYSYITQELSQVDARLLGSNNFCTLYMDKECITNLDKASIIAKMEDFCNKFDKISTGEFRCHICHSYFLWVDSSTTLAL
ncbi:hypothetical protein [Candidatus Hodarchaeum mangrovi]